MRQQPVQRRKVGIVAKGDLRRKTGKMRNINVLVQQKSKWGRLATLFDSEYYEAQDIDYFLRHKNEIKFDGIIAPIGGYYNFYGCAHVVLPEAKCQRAHLKYATLTDPTGSITVYIGSPYTFESCEELLRANNEGEEFLLQELIIIYNGRKNMQWLLGFENILPGETPFAPKNRTFDYDDAIAEIAEHLVKQMENKRILPLEELVDRYRFNAVETEILRQYACNVSCMLYNLEIKARTIIENDIAIFKIISINGQTKRVTDDFLDKLNTLRDETIKKLKHKSTGE